MLLRVIATVFLGLAAIPAAAQCVGESYLDQLYAADRASLDQATSNIPFGQGLLWRANKDDKQITVVGTMHIYDPRLEPIREKISADVQNADLVMLEATPDDQKALQELIVTKPEVLFITEGPTLPDRVDEETWALISDAAKARSVPAFMAAKMRPWYLSMLLSMPPCAMQDMVSGNLGLDHMIMEDAATADVPMQAVESVTTLFEIFNTDPLEEQIDMLRIGLLAPETQSQMFVAMLDRYFEGDIATLWEMSRFAMLNAPGVDRDAAQAQFDQTESALLVDRNRAWMPVIRDAAAENDRLVVAVGAAHLIGDDGIVQFLVNEGWNVTPIE